MYEQDYSINPDFLIRLPNQCVIARVRDMHLLLHRNLFPTFLQFPLEQKMKCIRKIH